MTLSLWQKMNFHNGVEHGSLVGDCFGHCRSSGLSRLFLNWLRISRSFGWVVVRMRDGRRRRRRRRMRRRFIVVVMVVVHLRE